MKFKDIEGPDDEGIFLENGCALGHVRLSILDLYRDISQCVKRKKEIPTQSS